MKLTYIASSRNFDELDIVAYTLVKPRLLVSFYVAVNAVGFYLLKLAYLFYFSASDGPPLSSSSSSFPFGGGPFPSPGPPLSGLANDG